MRQTKKINEASPIIMGYDMANFRIIMYITLHDSMMIRELVLYGWSIYLRCNYMRCDSLGIHQRRNCALLLHTVYYQINPSSNDGNFQRVDHTGEYWNRGNGKKSKFRVLFVRLLLVELGLYTLQRSTTASSIFVHFFFAPRENARRNRDNSNSSERIFDISRGEIRFAVSRGRVYNI